MIVLGVALAGVALLVVLFVGVGGGETVTVSAFGVDVTASSFVVFLGGAATLLVLLIGLWMIRWGVTRYSRTRSEMQRLRRIEAEVEARQIASLSADPAGAQTHHTLTDQEPAPTHHAPPPPETWPSRDDDERRDDRPVSATRPFEKVSEPSGATATEADRTDVVRVSDRDGDRDGDGARDNSRL